MMHSLISGSVAMSCWVVGLFFHGFWRKTLDRLFQIFAYAFWILGIERIIPVVFEIADETRTYVYLIRLLAFVLILFAILNKNRGASGKTKG